MTPYAGIEYSHGRRQDFIETGAGTANLTVDEEDQDSLRASLGLRLSHDIETRDGKRITPYLDAAWAHEFLDNISSLDAGFSPVPASTFRINGTDLDRDNARFGAGISGQLDESTSLNLAYTGQLAGSDTHHQFSLAFRHSW